MRRQKSFLIIAILIMTASCSGISQQQIGEFESQCRVSDTAVQEEQCSCDKINQWRQDHPLNKDIMLPDFCQRRLELAAKVDSGSIDHSQMIFLIHNLNAYSCTTYGFQLGTSAFANCLQQKDNADREEAIATANAHAAALANAAAILQQSSQNFQNTQNQIYQNQQNQLMMNHPITCNTNRFGTSSQTTCY